MGESLDGDCGVVQQQLPAAAIGSLLTHLVDSEDLTSGALHLVNLVQEVPEARLGHNLINSSSNIE